MSKFNDYHTAPGVKEVCENLRSEDISVRKSAETTIAYHLFRFGRVTKDCYLVPVPQKKSGKATYTLDICKMISMFTGAKILNIVERVPNSNKFFRTNMVPQDAKVIVFVDDRISTGKTYEKINDLFDQELVPLVFAVDYSMIKNLSILENTGDPVFTNVDDFKKFLDENCTDGQTIITIDPNIFQKEGAL